MEVEQENNTLKWKKCIFAEISESFFHETKAVKKNTFIRPAVHHLIKLDFEI